MKHMDESGVGWMMALLLIVGGLLFVLFFGLIGIVVMPILLFLLVRAGMIERNTGLFVLGALIFISLLLFTFIAGLTLSSWGSG